MPNLTLRQCPYCDKVVSGTAALIAHMKHCKKQRCQECDAQGACPKEMQLYFVECQKAKSIP